MNVAPIWVYDISKLDKYNKAEGRVIMFKSIPLVFLFQELESVYGKILNSNSSEIPLELKKWKIERIKSNWAHGKQLDPPFLMLLRGWKVADGIHRIFVARRLMANTIPIIMFNYDAGIFMSSYFECYNEMPET